MKGMCKDVHEKEDYTTRYLMTETQGKDSPEFIMVETYALLPTTTLWVVRCFADVV